MNISKYYGYFLIQAKRVKFHYGDLLVRVLMIVLRLALPYSVFSILAKTGQIEKSQVNAMLWAVMIGQVIYGSSLKMDRRIREDIKNGDITIRLMEPIGYVGGVLSRALGHFLPNYLILMTIFGLGLGLLFPTNINLGVLGLFTLTSFLILNLANIIVGLTSFVVEENDGVQYIVSKLFFIFGNQVIPVALMPVGVIGLAKLTPFYLGLAAPIEAASGRLDVLAGLVWSVFYIVILAWIAEWLLRNLRKKLILNG